MSWSFFGAFCLQYMDILIQSVFFTIQGVPKMKNAKKWAKVEINDFNQYNCSPERVAFMRWSFLGAFCLKYLDILFQSVFSLMP